jgi:hypothetical protein
MTTITPTTATRTHPYQPPRMDKWRIHFTHNGTAATLDTFAYTDDHAWDKGRIEARRKHWGEEICIARVEAI